MTFNVDEICHKDLFFSVMTTLFASETKEVISKYQKDLKSEMSSTQFKTLNDLLRKNKFNEAWFKECCSLKPEIKKEVFANALTRAFGKDNRNKILGETNVEMDKLFSNFALTNMKKIDSFYELLGIKKNEVEAFVQSKEKTDSENKNIDSLKEMERKHKKDIQRLKKENDAKVHDIEVSNKKNLEEIKKRHSEELESKNAEIEKLQEKLNDALKTQTVSSKETISSAESERKDLESPKYSFDKISECLEKRLCIGKVTSYNIKIRENMICITSVNPLVPESPFIDTKTFMEKVDYRGDVHQSVHFIDRELIDEFVDMDYSEFLMLPLDEKYNILFNTFCGKTILYYPELAKISDEKKIKINARILYVCEFDDFSSCFLAPKIDYQKLKEIQKHISEDVPFGIGGLSPCLINNIRYFVVGSDIYECDCTIDTNDISKEKWVSKDKKIKKVISIKNLKKDKDYLDYYDSQYIFLKADSLSNKAKISLSALENDFVRSVSEEAIKEHLCYSFDDIKNFHVSMKSSQIVILAGPSGIGKTRLPMLYAKCLGLKEQTDTLKFISVSPSYLEPSDLLGYVKPIINTPDGSKKISGEFEESSTMLVSFLKNASQDLEKMHIVIFDEMNLSQIEYWFAPFISILEKDEENRILPLYSAGMKIANEDQYPNSILIGRNVVFVGTVNIDETTKQMSDRLSDRSIVINLKKKSFSDYKAEKQEVENPIDPIPYQTYNSFVKSRNDYINTFTDREISFFDAVHKLFSESNAQKGVSFRNLRIISNYLENSSSVFERPKAFDFAFKQTILTKVNGSSLELEQIISEDQTVGLLQLFNDYSDISDFLLSKEIINKKIIELRMHGYTK